MMSIKVQSVTLAAATDLGIHGHFERKFVQGKTGIRSMEWLPGVGVIRIQREGKTSLIVPVAAVQAFEVLEEAEMDAPVKRGPGRPPKAA